MENSACVCDQLLLSHYILMKMYQTTAHMKIEIFIIVLVKGCQELLNAIVKGEAF